MRKKKDKRYDKRTLHAKAWKVWSTHRRKTAANFQGYATCYTCRKMYPWQEMHLGHWKHNKLDFDPLNTNPQCVGCNTYKHGHLDAYTLQLIADYGMDRVKELERRANTFGNSYTIEQLKQIINEYK